VATVGGGVVLGNPTFLPAFPIAGTPPNLYGTADPALGASPTLSRTVTMDLDRAFGAIGLGGVLFNGLTREVTYLVEAFSGTALVDAQTFVDVPANFDRGFALFSLESDPITRVVITPADPAEWSYFVDTIQVTPVPEPSTLALGGLGLLGAFGYARWRTRTA